MDATENIAKEVGKMLKEFNEYFSYLHGKTDAVSMAMPPAALKVWERVYFQLTPDERKRAKESVYEECSFYPTPQKFKELVKGSDDAEAFREWIIVIDALRRSQDDALKIVQGLSNVARRALQSLGGLNNLGMMNESTLHFQAKQSFFQAYKMAKASLAPHELEQIDEREVPKDQASAIYNQLLSTLAKK